MPHIRQGRFAAAILSLFAFATTGAVADSIRDVSSEVCQSCHKEIFQQWKTSMHANSTALKDPIHGTFYKNVVGDPLADGVKMKNGKYPVCLQCHAPNAAIQKQTKLDTKPSFSEGVNCVACHTLKSFKGIQKPDGKLRLGMMAYETTDEALQGPAGFTRGLQELTAANDMFGGAGGDDDAKPNPHLGEPVDLDGKQIPALPMVANAGLLKTNDACMGCHDKRNNAHGVPLCATGNEISTSMTGVGCQSCHMPINNGIADHSMGGGHDASMLKRSIVFTMDAENAGDKIMVKANMKNLQPHALPTGAPFRNIQVRISAYDAEGNVVWENDPMNEEGHPAYLAYLLADDAGKDALPPTATQLGADTRLGPHSERSVSYQVPAEGVALVRGEVHYYLMWKVLNDKFTHLPEDLRSSQVIAVAEAKL